MPVGRCSIVTLPALVGGFRVLWSRGIRIWLAAQGLGMLIVAFGEGWYRRAASFILRLLLLGAAALAVVVALVAGWYSSTYEPAEPTPLARMNSDG